MPSTSFSFDPEELSNEFTLLDNADPSEWAEIEVEMDFKLHPAKPDIGIFSSQPELTDIRYIIDGVTFGSEKELVDAVYNMLEDQIEEGIDFVAGAIAKQIQVWEWALSADE